MLSLSDEISPAIHNQISKHKSRLRKRLRGVCEGLHSEKNSCRKLVSESTPCETVQKIRIDTKVWPVSVRNDAKESIFCHSVWHPSAYTLLTLPVLFISRS